MTVTKIKGKVSDIYGNTPSRGREIWGWERDGEPCPGVAIEINSAATMSMAFETKSELYIHRLDIFKLRREEIIVVTVRTTIKLTRHTQSSKTHDKLREVKVKLTVVA